MSELSELAKLLLKPGEVAEKLDLSGWIVMSKLLKVGQDIIIDWPDNTHPRLFDKPIRATVDGISILGTLRLTNHTHRVFDSHGSLWATGQLFGYFDVKYYVWKILNEHDQAAAHAAISEGRPGPEEKARTSTPAQRVKGSLASHLRRGPSCRSQRPPALRQMPQAQSYRGASSIWPDWRPHLIILAVLPYLPQRSRAQQESSPGRGLDPLQITP